MGNTLINMTKAAEIAGVSRPTLTSDIKKGLIVPESQTDYETFFTRAEIDRYMVKRGSKRGSTKIITIVNHKGGVGKSTVVINIAHFLSENGYKTLILDNDPQGNVSNYFLFDKKSGRTNRMAMLYEDELLDESKIDKTDYKNLDIVSTNTALAEIELKVKSKIRGDDTLKRALSKPESYRVVSKYDFVLIDNKPDLGTFVFNSMSASHGVLIPTEARLFSIDGVKAIFTNVTYTDSKILGIVLNFFRSQTTESKKALEFYKTTYKEYMFNTVLPSTVNLSLGDLDANFEFQRKESAYISGDKDTRKLINDLGEEFLKKVNNLLY